MRMFRNAPQDCGRLRTAGILLMAVGVVLLLRVIPYRFWLAALGALLLIIGFLMWRFG